MFASAPQSVVFDEVDDQILSPVTPEAINEIKFWVKLSQETDDMYNNSLLGIDIWHSDTNEWETIANLNYWYIQNSQNTTGSNVYVLNSDAIGTEDVTQVRLYMVQKGEIVFYIDNIELNYKQRRDISYLAQDLVVNDTKASFDGLNPKDNYYVWVKAQKDGITSDASNPVWVDGVNGLIPDAPAISNVTPTSFTASWNPIGKADTYTLDVKKILTAKEDMMQVLINEENFDAITETGTDWYSPLDFSTKGWANTSWSATQPAWQNGMAGSQGTSYWGTAGLVFSPRLNLSANNGTFDVDFTAVTTTDKYDFGGETGVIDEGICVYVLKNYTDQQALAGYVFDTPTVGSNSFKFTFENKNGADFSDVIVAFLTKTGSAFYIDNVKITQDLKAGESLELPYTTVNTRETSHEFTGLDSKFDHAVTLYGSLSANYRTYRSETSEPSYALTSSGVPNTLTDNKINVYGTLGQIIITAPGNTPAQVFNLSGVLVTSVRGSAAIPAEAGVYIVSVDGRQFKIFVR